MTQTAPTAASLRQHIRQETDACSTLLGLLHTEREALKSRDVDKLEEVIQAKSAFLLQLEQGARQRSQWVPQKTPGGQKSEALWLDLLRRLDPTLESDWEGFRDLLKQCQDQNEINGKLLARNQQVFARLLSIVRGQNENSPLYTPKGNRGGAGTYQKLGEA